MNICKRNFQFWPPGARTFQKNLEYHRLFKNSRRFHPFRSISDVLDPSRTVQLIDTYFHWWDGTAAYTRSTAAYTHIGIGIGIFLLGLTPSLLDGQTFYGRPKNIPGPVRHKGTWTESKHIVFFYICCIFLQDKDHAKSPQQVNKF